MPVISFKWTLKDCQQAGATSVSSVTEQWSDLTVTKHIVDQTHWCSPLHSASDRAVTWLTGCGDTSTCNIVWLIEKWLYKLPSKYQLLSLSDSLMLLLVVFVQEVVHEIIPAVSWNDVVLCKWCVLRWVWSTLMSSVKHHRRACKESQVFHTVIT